jgi:putative membrane protein
MKSRFLILVAAALLVAAIGCKKTETTDTYASATNTSTTTTAGAPTTISKEDTDFATAAAQGNIAEISGGAAAAQKGTSPDVKAFGNRMVTDHGKALDELKQLATTKGITLPTDVNADQKAEADKLAKLSGKAFDKEYADAMVKDHEADAAEFEKASKNAQDPDLKAWAAKMLPVIQDHLKMAKEMKGKV